MLSEVYQSDFSAYDSTFIYPVSNKRGQKGATYVDLTRVLKTVLMDILLVAYNKIAIKQKRDHKCEPFSIKKLKFNG